MDFSTTMYIQSLTWTLRSPTINTLRHSPILLNNWQGSKQSYWKSLLYFVSFANKKILDLLEDVTLESLPSAPIFDFLISFKILLVAQKQSNGLPLEILS